MVSVRNRALALALLLLRYRLARRRFGIHPINRGRLQHGEYHHLMPKLREHPDRFREYFRMPMEQFDHLLQLVHNSIVKNSYRPSIGPEERLVITLRFLATGETFRSMAYRFRIGRRTAQIIVTETCRIIYTTLAPLYLCTPRTQEEWLQIAHDFQTRWDLPHALGCIDGKHIRIRKPGNSCSLYYNYHGYFSTVLMAVADANYRIIYIDVGSYGHNNDAGIYERSDLLRCIRDGSLNLPDPAPLPGTGEVATYFFVGDSAFPLSTFMMRPFPMDPSNRPRTVYNYRLSRGRRIIENVFGILSSKWRVLHSTIGTSPAVVDDIVKACCALHNFLIDEISRGNPAAAANDANDDAANRLDNWRGRTMQNRATDDAHRVQNLLVDYFSNAGALEWQDQHIGFDG